MNRNQTMLYRALLLDLDGTLLDLDIEKFIPAYIEALAGEFDGLINRDAFTGHLMGATRSMIANTDPRLTNREVFYAEFCRSTGRLYEEIEPTVTRFYRETFPRLKRWGQEHPRTRELIEAAERRKLTLVLATNPIFPPAAILERMSWGSLAREDFALVTTMDNMHSCKPNPAYYREIASKLDLQPAQCLMAGNDTLEDLNAAGAGMDTFLVEDYILERPGVKPNCTYRGSLEDLVALVEELPA